jgi:hypothetical protein
MYQPGYTNKGAAHMMQFVVLTAQLLCCITAALTILARCRDLLHTLLKTTLQDLSALLSVASAVCLLHTSS